MIPGLVLGGCSSSLDDSTSEDTELRGSGGQTGSGSSGGFSSGGGYNAGGGPSAVGGAGSGGESSSGGALHAGGASAAGGSALTGGTDNGATGSGGSESVGGASSSGGEAFAGGTSGDNGVFPPSVVTPKIMIVGDSVSAGPGCYKGHLKEFLAADGITNFEFVGEYSDDCGGGVRHSAVSCSTADNYTNAQFEMSNCSQGMSFPGMSALMLEHDPDMVMLQLGVNDVWGGSTPIQSVLDDYTTLTEQMRAHNPNVVVAVAQIHKINTINCGNGGFDASAEQLVHAVPAWAQGLTTDASPLFVADLWTNSFVDESNDCVHPNDAGAARMGENWFNAIKDLLR